MEVVTTTQIGLSGMPTFTRQKTANSHQGASNLSLSGQLSSQNSVSCNERLSRQSSTRGDQQAADGLLRKQRVAHYMQMERERAARARLERDEHSEWVNLRSLERAEIIKYLTDAEISELLHREAREVERVRLETEEVVKRGAEAALERRRSTTSMHLKVEKASLIHEIGGTDVSPGSVRMEGSESEGLTASTRTSTRCGPERSSERMGDVIVKLYRAQEDVIALKNTIKGIKYAQRVAEDKACREAERAEIEVGERMKAEALVRSYEKKVDELRKKISTLEERLESAKEKINSYAVAREEMTLLSAAKEQVKSLENENKELRERYNLLCSERNELLAKVAVESRRGETGSDLSPAAFSGHEAHLPASTLGRTSTSVGMDIFQGCATEDIQSLQREVEHHRNQLEAVTNDNAKLKAKLQLAIASKKKYEGIAQKIIKEKGSLPSREEYERLQREARRFKKSADEVRKELKSHRECSAREISSLREILNRLRTRYLRQTEELKCATASETVSPRPNTQREVQSRSVVRGLHSPVEAGGSNNGTKSNAASIKLLNQLKEAQARLQESIRNERRAVALSEVLQQEKVTNAARAKKTEAELHHQIEELTKRLRVRLETPSEPRPSMRHTDDDVEKLSEQLLLARRTIVELEREKRVIQNQRASSVGASDKSECRNRMADTEITRLQEALEKERSERLKAEQEAEAQRERAEWEAETRRKMDALLCSAKKVKHSWRCKS